MRKNYLLTPGPTPLPPKILEAMAQPIIHHRTPQFQAVLKEATEGLKYVFQTKNDVFILASSGTGAMEAARSEERRVGKECRRLCRSRWSPYH
jgi:aspartate aminotransferase-like enzyme